MCFMSPALEKCTLRGISHAASVMAFFVGSLYSYTLSDDSAKKFNPDWPHQAQWTHDQFWTTVSMTMASGFESMWVDSFSLC